MCSRASAQIGQVKLDFSVCKFRDNFVKYFMTGRKDRQISLSKPILCISKYIKFGANRC